MKGLDEIGQAGEFALVIGEILVNVHVVNIVPLDVERDSGISGPAPDLPSPLNRSIVESAQVKAKAPIRRHMGPSDDLCVLLDNLPR